MLRRTIRSNQNLCINNMKKLICLLHIEQYHWLRLVKGKMHWCCALLWTASTALLVPWTGVVTKASNNTYTNYSGFLTGTLPWLSNCGFSAMFSFAPTALLCSWAVAISGTPGPAISYRPPQQPWAASRFVPIYKTSREKV